MPNIIKQIITNGNIIKMIVKSNERGPKGEQGDPGVTATISAGQAYSIPTNQQPAVINSGTTSEAIFDFYIPKGERGEQGIPGKDGVVQYIAGSGIRIKDNVISATGGGGGGSVSWGDIEGDIADQTDLQNEFSQYTKSNDLALVATTGSYNDLSNKPTIPAAQIQSDWTQSDNTKLDYIKNKPTIPSAQVNSDWNATTGVAAILNKPTIPTVNNSTITLTNNGTTVGSFTTNAATSKSIDFSTPVITMQSTDPGEGSPLAENTFVAVYNAS